MSYAVIKTGGKQYRVEEGQTLLVERLPDEPGATVDLVPLLLAGDGDPVLDSDKLAKSPVRAEIVAHEANPALAAIAARHAADAHGLVPLAERIEEIPALIRYIRSESM